jgi:hypothetical protein
MKLTRLAICVTGAAWFGLVFAGMPRTVKADGPTPAASISTLTDNISNAKTPSDVIAAYAKATAAAGDGDVNLEQAFISRMVSLGAPELADAQAQDLSGRSDSGLPWAVLAHNDAQKNQLDAAIANISQGVKASPSNEFVARTAGEIVAWYDAQPRDAKISGDTRQTADEVRKLMSSRRPYAQAYDDVQKAYGPQDENQGTQVVVANGTLGDLAAFSGNHGYGPYASTPMAMFYAAPYVAFSNYSYGYQPWGPRIYSSGAFARLGDRAPFPTPTIGADVRYLRTPTPNNGFVLLCDAGDISYFPAYYPPVYAGYYGTPFVYSGGFYPGVAGGFYGSGFAVGGAGGYGYSGRSFSRGGYSAGRLPSRMGGFRLNNGPAGTTPFQPMSTPFQPVTTPGAQPFMMGGRPGFRSR